MDRTLSPDHVLGSRPGFYSLEFRVRIRMLEETTHVPIEKVERRHISVAMHGDRRESNPLVVLAFKAQETPALVIDDGSGNTITSNEIV